MIVQERKVTRHQDILGSVGWPISPLHYGVYIYIYIYISVLFIQAVNNGDQQTSVHLRQLMFNLSKICPENHFGISQIEEETAAPRSKKAGLEGGGEGGRQRGRGIRVNQESYFRLTHGNQ